MANFEIIIDIDTSGFSDEDEDDDAHEEVDDMNVRVVEQNIDYNGDDEDDEDEDDDDEDEDYVPESENDTSEHEPDDTEEDEQDEAVHLHLVNQLSRPNDFVNWLMNEYDVSSDNDESGNETETPETNEEKDIVIEDKVIEEDTCVICSEKLNKCNLTVCACGHQFHATCLFEWLSTKSSTYKKCPICRKQVFK